MAWVNRLPFGQTASMGTVDADPTAGLAADEGSLAFLDTGLGSWIKTGAGDADWTPTATVNQAGGAPDANYDVADGVLVGSTFIDTTGTPSVAYICLDNSAGAAVWKQMSGVHVETGDPITTNDDAAGFSTGDVWINSTNQKVLVCTDNSTGAASWFDVGGTGQADYLANGTFRATYDFATHGGVSGGANLFGPIIPDNCYITEAHYEVITTFESPTGPDNATVGLGVQDDDATGIVASAVINTGTPWDATGAPVLTVCDGTLANFTTKTTDLRQFLLTVGVEDITAGRLVLFGRYAVTE
jgi:hypothetical protein